MELIVEGEFKKDKNYLVRSTSSISYQPPLSPVPLGPVLPEIDGLLLLQRPIPVLPLAGRQFGSVTDANDGFPCAL